LDGYTVISYFEEGSKKGFYVLDLPNLFVASKGYFVGASSIPFTYQGTANSTAANFSWNDPNLPLNYGYMRKWVSNGGTSTMATKIMILKLCRRILMISLAEEVAMAQLIMPSFIKMESWLILFSEVPVETLLCPILLPQCRCSN
jgi:hypothetical protein